MRIIALNCSPRRGWNTAQMLESALKGAADNGAETQMYHLYSMDFRGCSSCFECLRLGGPSHGRCALKDDLKPVLDDVLSCDGFFVGSPVYFSNVTACCRAFLERLWFGGLRYSKENRTLYERRVPSRYILTTNAPQEGFHKALNEGLIRTMTSFLGPTDIIEANNTWQFDDYSKYDADMFDVEDRRRQREEVFPKDLEKAYGAGAALAEGEQKG